MRIKYIFCLLSLFLLSALTACAQKEELSDGTKLIDKGKFIFAASGEFKPFSYLNNDLSMTGFDIEVGNAVGKELGLKPVQKRMKFKGLIEGIKTGRADAAVASHTINPDRAKHVAFSTPYYYSGPQIFTRPDSNIKTVEDLKGKEVAVAKGSTYADVAGKYTSNLKMYDSDITALKALSMGRHDAVITDFVTGKSSQQEGFKIKGQQLIERSEQAIVVPKDNPELLKRINKALQKLRDDGTLARISQKYFGQDITKKPE
ncbi:transporter substrate-binding domain-containing protein [Neobacillus mesonae]|uniref:transporter substrate-binding domain-containing protein n=1 Tax=Neobacillus mesonae TaxID=1193713 RepID=UPI0008295853|nr:transporter substrate-binding domain-containing protein [Neobacillus mesonae]MED4206141.1 transporter substrate-binding domain-containing protein [Neobacillus mesonae]